MKKVFSVLITFVLVILLTTSCKKSCVCYDHEGKQTDHGKSLTTKSDCEGFSLGCRAWVDCEWK